MAAVHSPIGPDPTHLTGTGSGQCYPVATPSLTPAPWLQNVARWYICSSTGSTWLQRQEPSPSLPLAALVPSTVPTRHEGRVCLGVPLTLFVCYRAHARKFPWHPLLPSSPMVSPDPSSAWPGPFLLSTLSHLSAGAIRPCARNLCAPLARAQELLGQHQFRQRQTPTT